MSIQPNVKPELQPDVKPDLVLERRGFDYAVLDPELALEAQAASAFILAKMKQTVENIVVVGFKLHRMKQLLPHGQFGKWIKEEFGWSATTESNYRAVADWLGGKVTIIVNLPIAPTAAYLLAARSTPEMAREEALRLAKEGQEVTNLLAKEIVAEARRKNGEKRKGRPSHRMLAQLTRTLAECQESCPEDSRSEVARQLREAAGALEGAISGSQKQPPQ